MSHAARLAAQRVQAYLDDRAEQPGLDQESIIGINGGHSTPGGSEITRSDLQAMIDAVGRDDYCLVDGTGAVWIYRTDKECWRILQDGLTERPDWPHALDKQQPHEKFRGFENGIHGIIGSWGVRS